MVAKFPKAVAKISDDVEQLLAFYDFPAEHWIHRELQIRSNLPSPPCGTGARSPRAPVRQWCRRRRSPAPRQPEVGGDFDRKVDHHRGGPVAATHCAISRIRSITGVMTRSPTEGTVCRRIGDEGAFVVTR